MPTTLEAYDRLSDLIKKQEHDCDSLDHQIAAVSSDISAIRDQAVSLLSGMFPYTDDNSLSRLKTIAQRTDHGADFAAMIDTLQQEDEKLLMQKTQIAEEWGSEESIIEKHEMLIEKLETSKLAAKDKAFAQHKAEDSLNYLNNRHRLITTHNEKHPDCPINEQNWESFSKNNVSKWIKGAGFRDALKTYTAYDGDYPADRERSRTLAEDIAQRGKAINELAAEINDYEKSYSDLQPAFDIVNHHVKGPEAIHNAAYNAVLDLLSQDKNFIGAFTEEVGVDLAKPLVVATNKIEGLSKIQTGLNDQRTQNEEILKKLRKPMEELRYAKINDPSQIITLNLGEIEKGVDAALAQSKHKVDNAARACQAVQTYNHDNNDLFSVPNLLLTWVMLDFSDNGALHALGIGDEKIDTNLSNGAIPDGASLDALKDIGNATGLSSNFNDIHIADTKVNISIPDISPSNTSNDIDGFDGGMGGFDSGM